MMTMHILMHMHMHMHKVHIRVEKANHNEDIYLNYVILNISLVPVITGGLTPTCKAVLH